MSLSLAGDERGSFKSSIFFSPLYMFCSLSFCASEANNEAIIMTGVVSVPIAGVALSRWIAGSVALSDAFAPIDLRAMAGVEPSMTIYEWIAKDGNDEFFRGAFCSRLKALTGYSVFDLAFAPLSPHCRDLWSFSALVYYPEFTPSLSCARRLSLDFASLLCPDVSPSFAPSLHF